ncbi:hypothetical protein N9L68_09395 [bacterium]|nr:hypothetical protein [bacterium]
MPLVMASGNAADDVCSYSGACFCFFRSTVGTYISSGAHHASLHHGDCTDGAAMACPR